MRRATSRKELIQIFPELNEIADETMRERAGDALLAAMEKGGWNKENLAVCPVTLNWKNCDVNLLEHLKDVVRMTLQNYEIASKYYRRHGVRFDRDIIICGALLHDIGKFTEYAERDGKPVYSANAQLMRHPLSGAIIAAKAGLPDDIIHIIAVHSFEGEHSYQTAESAFVRSIDDFVFRCSVWGLKQ